MASTATGRRIRCNDGTHIPLRAPDVSFFLVEATCKLLLNLVVRCSTFNRFTRRVLLLRAVVTSPLRPIVCLLQIVDTYILRKPASPLFPFASLAFAGSALSWSILPCLQICSCEPCACVSLLLGFLLELHSPNEWQMKPVQAVHVCLADSRLWLCACVTARATDRGNKHVYEKTALSVDGWIDGSKLCMYACIAV
eukprot:6207694-Pleurochrysis_carterae.AAC.2